MSRLFHVSLLVLLLASMAGALALQAAPPPGMTPPAPVPVRIGTYDSRAVAIAYAASRHNPVNARMAEYEAAKARGDEAKVQELEAWGQALQRQLHRQGFGRVPVTDLLRPVADRLADVAADAGVSAIVFECNWTRPDVKTVDLTMEIVALYDPTPKTLEHARQIMRVKPVALDEIEAGHDH